MYQKSYISWIPNISNMLMFSLVDPLDYRKDRIVGDIIFSRQPNSNIEDKHHLEPFLISMLVDFRDYRDKDATSKYTRVIFTASPQSSKSTNELKGEFYFLDDSENLGLYKSKEEKECVKRFHESTEEHEWNESIKDLITYYYSNTEKKKFTAISYTLKENGIITFAYKDSSVELDAEKYEVDVNQAYYFIKFIFHKDRFHPKTNEQIVPIIPYNDEKNLDNYVLQMAEGIERNILTRRKENSNNFFELQALQGMISYIKVLLNLINADHSEDIKKVDQISDGISKELKQLHPVSIPTFGDFAQDLKTWIVIIFAIITPYIISSKPTFKSLQEYFLNMALPYYGIGLGFAMLATLFIRFAQTYKTCFILVKIIDFLKFFVGGIKKYSRPSIGQNPLTFFIFPGIINIEMFTRRIELNWKKSVSSVISILLLITFVIGLFLIYKKYTTTPYLINKDVEKSLLKYSQEENKTFDLDMTLKLKLERLSVHPSTK